MPGRGAGVVGAALPWLEGLNNVAASQGKGRGVRRQWHKTRQLHGAPRTTAAERSACRSTPRHIRMRGRKAPAAAAQTATPVWGRERRINSAHPAPADPAYSLRRFALVGSGSAAALVGDGAAAFRLPSCGAAALPLPFPWGAGVFACGGVGRGAGEAPRREVPEEAALRSRRSSAEDDASCDALARPLTGARDGS
jgi:hypothetical protein